MNDVWDSILTTTPMHQRVEDPELVELWKEQLDDAYNLGYDMHGEGATLADNPLSEMPLWKAWNNGWTHAQLRKPRKLLKKKREYINWLKEGF